jgi:hypothetical protein
MKTLFLLSCRASPPSRPIRLGPRPRKRRMLPPSRPRRNPRKQIRQSHHQRSHRSFPQYQSRGIVELSPRHPKYLNHNSFRTEMKIQIRLRVGRVPRRTLRSYPAEPLFCRIGIQPGEEVRHGLKIEGGLEANWHEGGARFCERADL